MKGVTNMFIKVAKLGSPVKEVMINEGGSVEDAIYAAGMSSTGYQVRVNGRTPCGSLREGDTITLVPSIKGGSVVSLIVRIR